MKEFVSFHDIKQFRNAIRNIGMASQYIGQDEDGNPIYDITKTKPTLVFHGTVKLHGTNAGVSFSEKDGMWFQSRKNIISVEKDNAGFAFFAYGARSVFQSFFDSIFEKEQLNTNDTVTIFGEWAGMGIQKGVGISELEKMFVIFAVKVKPEDININPYYVDSDYLHYDDSGIYNVEDFKTYDIEIDFENPKLAQNKMIELVAEVEAECPVAKQLGASGVGEGIVWTSNFRDNKYWFKTKGEKHSTSKVKVLVPVDVEKLNSINEFIDYAVTENRLNQGIEQVFTTNSSEPAIVGMGDFLRWIMKDIIKEEIDVLEENNITPKEIGKKASGRAREWFINLLDERAGIK